MEPEGFETLRPTLGASDQTKTPNLLYHVDSGDPVLDCEPSLSSGNPTPLTGVPTPTLLGPVRHSRQRRNGPFESEGPLVVGVLEGEVPGRRSLLKVRPVRLLD